jgi:toxin ParE1/3/4
VAGYYLTAAAHADLVDIADRTFERWGEHQEHKYIGDLYRRFADLAANLNLGRACDEIRQGLRRIGQGSHVVYFRAAGEELEIVRVLHERMLPEKHFKF